MRNSGGGVQKSVLSQALQRILWTTKYENHSFNGHDNLSCLFPLVSPEKFSSKFFHGDIVTRALNFSLWVSALAGLLNALCPTVFWFGVTRNRQSYRFLSVSWLWKCAPEGVWLWSMDSESLENTHGSLYNDHMSCDQSTTCTGGCFHFITWGLTNFILWMRRPNSKFIEHSLNPSLSLFLPCLINHLATPE